MKGDEVDTIIKTINQIASYAMEGMLFEVSATPKPGLVDRNNCGAHRDMDYFTFMSSAASLHATFENLVRLGWENRNKPVKELLSHMRIEGIDAETKMFAFTEGVNTHKGMIFTLGILCGCAGWSLGRDDLKLDYHDLSTLAADMCEGICAREFRGIEKKIDLTKGEKMYMKYGCTGARGEVESGFATVGRISLPKYRRFRDGGISVNDALVQTLLYLIAETVDTNIISRHNMEIAKFAMELASQTLEKGGVFTAEGRKAILDMDVTFIEQYISPGGCADLLAVTHFLYCLEKMDKI